MPSVSRRLTLAGLIGLMVLGWVTSGAQARTQKGTTAAELGKQQEWGEAPEDVAPGSHEAPAKANPYASPGGEKPARKLGESETLNRLFPVGTPTPERDPMGREIAEHIRALSGESHQRQKAIERLATLGKPAVPALRKALRDAYKFTRIGALSALGYIRDKTTAPDIERLLGDPSSEVRTEAVKSLGLMKYKFSLPKLTILLGDSEPRVRRELAIALGRIRGDQSRQALIRCLQDPVPDVRCQAAQELPVFESADTVEALLAATYDTDIKTCGFAIRALGEIGDASAGPRLRVLARSRDRFIRDEALNALQNLQ